MNVNRDHSPYINCPACQRPFQVTGEPPRMKQHQDHRGGKSSTCEACKAVSQYTDKIRQGLRAAHRSRLVWEMDRAEGLLKTAIEVGTQRVQDVIEREAEIIRIRADEWLERQAALAAFDASTP